MRNLLQIERNLLQNAEVREHLQLQAVEHLQSTINNGQKAKFAKSVDLAILVKAGVAWFSTPECQAILTEEGISWTKEEFFLKVYGWQKSFAYKMLKLGTFAQERPEVLTAFINECNAVERGGDVSNRTIEGFLQYASSQTPTETGDSASGGDESEGGEGDSEGTTSAVTRVATLFTMSYDAITVDSADRKVAVRVTAANELKTANTPEEIGMAIGFLQNVLAHHLASTRAANEL